MRNGDGIFPILETDRLLLRKVSEEDASSVLKYLSDSEIMKHIGLKPLTTIEEALDEISWYQSIFKKGTGIRWGITLKEQGEVIGSCGFLNRAPQHYRAEIGTELSKDHWGRALQVRRLKRSFDMVLKHFRFKG